DKRIFPVEQRAFNEASHVMDLQHVAAVSLPGYPVPLVRRLMRLPFGLPRTLVGSRLARSRGGGSPQMRSDLQRRKTEVGALHGAVVRGALSLDIETPVNRALAALVEELSATPKRQSEFRGKPDALLAYLK